MRCWIDYDLYLWSERAKWQEKQKLHSNLAKGNKKPTVLWLIILNISSRGFPWHWINPLNMTRWCMKWLFVEQKQTTSWLIGMPILSCVSSSQFLVLIKIPRRQGWPLCMCECVREELNPVIKSLKIAKKRKPIKWMKHSRLIFCICLQSYENTKRLLNKQT